MVTWFGSGDIDFEELECGRVIFFAGEVFFHFKGLVAVVLSFWGFWYASIRFLATSAVPVPKL